MAKNILLVFSAACCFGIMSSFVKIAYSQGYSTAEVTCAQGFTGMVILWVLYLLTSRKGISHKYSGVPGQSGKGWFTVLLTGMPMGFATYLYYTSVKFIPASVAVILLMQFIWMELLVEWLLYKKKPNGRHVTGMAIVLLGTVMASGFSLATGWNLDPRGCAAALGSAFLYALYLIANGRLGNNLPVFEKGALFMTGSTMAILMVSLPALISHTHFGLDLLKWAIFLAMFGTIIPPVLLSKSVHEVGVALSSIIMTAELPVAVITSHFLLNEKVSVVQWTGTLIMLMAMVLVNTTRTHRIHFRKRNSYEIILNQTILSRVTSRA